MHFRTITGQDPARLSVVFDEVIIKERLLVEGGNSGTILSEFDGPVNFSKNVKIGGTLTVTGAFKNVQPIEVTDSTDSWDKDSGCMILEGGLGVEKNVNIGLGASVGLGLTVGTLLDVNGNADIAGTLGVTGTATFTGDLTSGGGTFGNVRVGVTGDNEIDTSSGNLTIDSTGGTTTIDDNVSVSGTLNVSSTGTFGGAISVGGNVTASGVLDINGTGTNALSGPLDVSGTIRAIGADVIAYASSDENLKDNITPIPNALSKVISISGNTFNWNEKSDYEGKSDTGVVAQEIEKLGLPGVVETRADGFKAVRYDRLVPVLIEAIKELSAKVDDLS